MSLYQWLLFFHVTGAFFLIGGIVVAGILNLAALVKDRPPSEVAALYGLIRFAVPLIGAPPEPWGRIGPGPMSPPAPAAPARGRPQAAQRSPAVW